MNTNTSPTTHNAESAAGPSHSPTTPRDGEAPSHRTTAHSAEVSAAQECTPDAPCVACLATRRRAAPTNDATAQKAPRSAAKRWTWKRLHREVLGHCAMDCDSEASLRLVYVLEDDRRAIAHTTIATLDLYRALASSAVASVARTLADEPESPGVIAFMARDLRHRAELLAGIAGTLENHADALAEKQGAGL